MLIAFYVVLSAVAATSAWAIERIDRPARRAARDAAAKPKAA